MNERQLAGSYGGHKSWSQTPDRSTRTAPGRAKFDQRFYPDDPTLPEHVREQMAESARKAYYQRLALASVKARRARKVAPAGDAA